MFPFRFPVFGYPYNNFYNYRRNNYYPYPLPYNKNINNADTNIAKEIPPKEDAITPQIEEKKDSSSEPFNDYFFEIFGLKLYFDDILIICLLFFLYEEGVKDQELFISLILLLLS